MFPVTVCIARKQVVSVAWKMSLCLMRAMCTKLPLFISAVILQMYDPLLLVTEEGGWGKIMYRVQQRNPCRQKHKSCHANQNRLQEHHISLQKTITDRTEKDGV